MRFASVVAAFCALAFLLPNAPAVAAAPAQHPAVHATLLQKTSAKRFKRGVRRTTKKIRHFIRRAAGKR